MTGGFEEKAGTRKEETRKRSRSTHFRQPSHFLFPPIHLPSRYILNRLNQAIAQPLTQLMERYEIIAWFSLLPLAL